jgi:hypothetical protein
MFCLVFKFKLKVYSYIDGVQKKDEELKTTNLFYCLNITILCITCIYNEKNIHIQKRDVIGFNLI